VYGAAVPLVLVVLLYLGFASTGAVLAGQAVNEIIGAEQPAGRIVVFGLLTRDPCHARLPLLHLLAGSPS